MLVNADQNFGQKSSRFGCPIRFSRLMSSRRFEAINQALSFTMAQPPEQPDRFWRVREMLAAWNDNMFQVFLPGIFTCIDESMSKWLARFTCPGFMVVPRKPWPFGNEYHTHCCCQSGVMFALEIVEGKDRPSHFQPPPFDHLGKTAGLVLCLTQRLWYTEQTVAMDSVFYVLKEIIELAKKGVFGSALIKK